VRCSRVVFAGSVLSHDFPTALLRGRSRMPFEELRNEIGLTDLVPRVAALVRRLVRHLGDAGLRGFVARDGHVHGVDDPEQPCAACREAKVVPAWLIHNVRIKEFAHSDRFITPKHAIQFWLPFLWKIEIAEFVEWLELCILASYAGSPGTHGHAALAAERRILGRKWGWAGSSIEEFVRQEYPGAAADMDDPVKALRVYRALWRAVARAADNADSHGDDPERMAHARALDPRVAVQVAVGVITK